MLTLIEASTGLPVPLDDVKINQLRIEHDDEDQHITDLIHAAHQMIEKALGRSFLSQTWEMTLPRFCDCLSCRCKIYLPFAPLDSVESIEYYDSNDVLQTMSVNDYYVVASTEERGFVQPKLYWPSVNCYRPDAVKITFITQDNNTNPIFVQLIKIWVTLLYENRTGEISKQEEATIDRLENLLRVYS